MNPPRQPICQISQVESLNPNSHKRPLSEIFSDEEEVKGPIQRNTASTLNSNFVREPSPEGEPSIYSDDDNSDDVKSMLELMDEWYGDLYEEGTLNEKIPRWRMHYELTGQVDKIFRGEKKMQVKISDALDVFKFTNEDKTSINLNEPTNKLIISYETKKSSKPLITAANATQCPIFGIIQPPAVSIPEPRANCGAVIQSQINEDKSKLKLNIFEIRLNR